MATTPLSTPNLMSFYHTIFVVLFFLIFSCYRFLLFKILPDVHVKIFWTKISNLSLPLKCNHLRIYFILTKCCDPIVGPALFTYIVWHCFTHSPLLVFFVPSHFHYSVANPVYSWITCLVSVYLKPLCISKHCVSQTIVHYLSLLTPYLQNSNNGHFWSD